MNVAVKVGLGIVALIVLLWFMGEFRGDFCYWVPYPLGYHDSPAEKLGIPYRPNLL